MKIAWAFNIILFLTFGAIGQSTNSKAVAKGVPKSQKLIDQLTSKPTFPGGDMALQAFLQKNAQYPQMERDNDIRGTVTVGFFIDKAGKATNIKIKKSVSPGLDKEVKRLVKMMPDWAPGMYNNKPVPVYYTLDFAFKIL